MITKTTLSTTLLFIALLLLAMAYRMVNLTAQSIWVDEGFTWFLTQQPDLLAVLKTDVHPPLYFALVTLWVQVAGTSELSLRYLSVLPSVLCLAMMVPLAHEIWRLRPQATPTRATTFALIAMALMAIADMDIYIAQEARAYTLHVLLAMISVWGMLRWHRTTQQRFALIWLISSVLLLYTQYFGAWLLVAQGMVAVLFWRGKTRIVGIAILCAVGILFLPWAILIIVPYQLQTIGGYTPADSSDLWTIGRYLVAYFSGQWVLTVGIAMVGFGAWATQRYVWRPINASVLLWLWLILPVAITFVLNAPNANLLFDYRLSQILPAVTLLIALGLMNFAPYVRVFLVCIIVVYGLIYVDAYRYKEDWRGYGRTIAEYVETDDALVLDFGGGDFQMHYYLQKFAPDTPLIALRQRAQLSPQTYESESLQFMDDYATLWLVRWNTSSDALDKLAFTGHTQTASIPIATQSGMNVWLYRYDRLNAQPVATFENGMVLQQVTLDTTTLKVNLWWRTQQTQTLAYTTSVLLLDKNGVVVAQQDNPPTPNTSEWQADNFYWERKTLQLVNEALITGETYRVAVQVYEWRPDGVVIVKAQGGDNPLIVDEFVHLP
jgi:mannosyltransferase